jgi:predicted DNA-binding transcriptional regulator
MVPDIAFRDYLRLTADSNVMWKKKLLFYRALVYYLLVIQESWLGVLIAEIRPRNVLKSTLEHIQQANISLLEERSLQHCVDNCIFKTVCIGI